MIDELAYNFLLVLLGFALLGLCSEVAKLFRRGE